MARRSGARRFEHARLCAIAEIVGSATTGCGSLDGEAAPDCQAPDIASRLACLPGARELSRCGTLRQTLPSGVVEIPCLQFEFQQPVDHDDPAGPQFWQRIRVLHRADTAPVIFTNTGYDLGAPIDIASQFSINLVEIEHRFFGTSIPSPPDWRTLTIWQAASDYHRAVAVLETIYTGLWVSMGHSKGGEAVVFHRRFFPDDVDATLAESAPNVHGTSDPRFLAFLDQVGGDEFGRCRTRLLDLQRLLLVRREEMLSRIEGAFDRIGGKQIAFEHAVLELPHTFWAMGDPDSPSAGCSAVPDEGASDDDLLRYFAEVTSFATQYGDDALAELAPYAYQAASELGYFAVKTDHLADLLDYADTHGAAHYAPLGAAPTFDARAMLDVQSWVTREGRALMFIYGERDPWRAAAFELGEASDSFSFIVPKRGHLSGVRTLTGPDRERAFGILERWLGIPPRAGP